MRALGITLISLALTTAVIGNAYYQKKQFYPSVVYITKSNPSMAVIYVQAFILVILMGKLMRKVFFGQLRAAEFEHLMERSWYAVTETCLAFTVFRDDFSPKFVALFTLLLFLKSFHWLAEDRVDYMERSPVISWLFHIRVVSLLLMLGALDLHFVGHAYQSTVTKGASVQLVFGFEYAILFTIIVNICIKYALHTIDLNSENPWDNKAVFLLYTELVMGFFKVILYIAFVAIMVRIYTLPLFAFRPMYYTMRGFKKAFNDVILSRRAIHNMNTLYPDATPEELAAADNVCIICREEMVSASKKLPCNHIFHTSCLRSWFQRQQTCPTCRLNILRTPTTPQAHPAAAAQPPAPPQHGAHPPPAPGALPQMPVGMNMFQPMPGPLPFWQVFQIPGAAAQRPADPQQQQQQSQQQQTVSGGTSTTPSQSTSTAAGSSTSQTASPPPTSSTQPGMTTGTNIPFLCPPFPFMPFIPPPPMPPANFTGLSTEELRRMEGTTRESIEARLQCLRNIQLLLDASVTMMQQYATVVAATSRMAQPSQPAASTPAPPAATVPSASPPSSAAVPEEGNTSTKAPVAESSHKNASKDMNGSCGEEPDVAGASENLPANSTLTKEQEEVRRRRLQKFGQSLAQQGSE
ncbi:E3 ubiquitin-protein ligase synoviolin B isoform X2 [Anabrus simplex]|uniref:E3 ubiquitin-protein ligase synoviolin B isoform X2 n=1 Tax=Anabrus simplex TaxID=316456 RepID=UPI0034DD6C82